MRVMVTGGWGFLGGHVCRELRLHNHFVFPIRHGDCDLLNPDDIQWTLEEVEPDAIVHLAAAVGGIGANQEHPGKFLYENAMMGLQLMEQARQFDVGKFVTIGTACSYPADAPLPLNEDDIWNGYPAPETAPYGIAKRLLLLQGQMYRQEYGFNAIHLIPTNLYGPGDNFDPETSHVIPGLIQRFSEAAKFGRARVKCWGTGEATREFLYVEDAATAIVAALERYDSPEPLNIGTGVETSVASVANAIADIYGYEGEIRWDRRRPDGAERRRMDVSRARTALGFEALTSLEQGLKATIEAYEAR